jgi:hypothetical protein
LNHQQFKNNQKPREQLPKVGDVDMECSSSSSEDCLQAQFPPNCRHLDCFKCETCHNIYGDYSPGDWKWEKASAFNGLEEPDPNTATSTGGPANQVPLTARACFLLILSIAFWEKVVDWTNK